MKHILIILLILSTLRVQASEESYCKKLRNDPRFINSFNEPKATNAEDIIQILKSEAKSEEACLKWIISLDEREIEYLKRELVSYRNLCPEIKKLIPFPTWQH